MSAFVSRHVHVVVVDETNNSDNNTSSSSNSDSSPTSTSVRKYFRPATAIDIKEPLRGKLLAICRLCKEAFSSLPSTAAASSSTSSSSTWCGVGKGSTIPSDIGYDPEAAVPIVFPWQLFAGNLNGNDNSDNNKDYLFINEDSKSYTTMQTVLLTNDGNVVSGGESAVPIAIAMARAAAKGSQGPGLSCQLTAGERESLTRVSERAAACRMLTCFCPYPYHI